MRYVLISFLFFSIGIATTVYSYRIERPDDFSPVYFDSGDDLPSACSPSDKPIIFFRRTDKRLFVCENGTWEETD